MVRIHIRDTIPFMKRHVSALRQTKLWYYFLLLLSIILGIATLVSFKAKNATQVQPHASGFYGPGVVTAWLTTSICYVGSGECLPMLKHTIRWLFTKPTKAPILPPPIVSRDRGQQSKSTLPVVDFVGVDAALTSVVFYPIIAAVDALNQSKHQSSDEAYLNSAADDVCCLSMFVSWLAIWATTNTPASIHKQYPILPTTTRMLTWYVMHLLCFIANYMVTLRGSKSLVWVAVLTTLFNSTWTFTKSMYSLGRALRIFNQVPGGSTTPANEPNVSPLGFFFALQALALPYMQYDRLKQAGYEATLVFTWPRSGSRFTDLDQWTAVAGACLLVAWPYIEACLHSMRRLALGALAARLGGNLGPDQVQNDGNFNPSSDQHQGI